VHALLVFQDFSRREFSLVEVVPHYNYQNQLALVNWANDLYSLTGRLLREHAKKVSIFHVQRRSGVPNLWYAKVSRWYASNFHFLQKPGFAAFEFAYYVSGIISK